MRESGFIELALVFDFLVELGGFGDGGTGGAVFLIFLRCGPVDEGGGKFLPVVALGAHVTDAVAFDFIFCDQLIVAVFEDEAAGEILSGGEGGKGEQKGQYESEERGLRTGSAEISQESQKHDSPIIVWTGGRVEFVKWWTGGGDAVAR